jgi:hypothetical protein
MDDRREWGRRTHHYQACENTIAAPLHLNTDILVDNQPASAHLSFVEYLDPLTFYACAIWQTCSRPAIHTSIPVQHMNLETFHNCLIFQGGNR